MTGVRRTSKTVKEGTRIVLLHRRTSAVVKVQRAFEHRDMVVIPVVTPDELVTACERLSPQMAIVRCSTPEQGLDIVRWIHGQPATTRLPVALLGPFDAASCPRGRAGLLGYLDERRSLDEVAVSALALAPPPLHRSTASGIRTKPLRPDSVLARLRDEGRHGLLVVSDDEGGTTVVTVGPEARRLGAAGPLAAGLGPAGTAGRVEFIETGDLQRLGLVDLRSDVGVPEVPALPADVRAVVIEHDEASAAASVLVLDDLGVDAVVLPPTPGWLEHAVDHRPDVLVSDARPRGPRGFDFLKEQNADPILCWVPTLLLTAPTVVGDAGRAAAVRVLATELHQTLSPRVELEAMLRAPGPVRGEIERYGLPRLLLATCELRVDAILGVRDEISTVVIAVRDGRPRTARQRGNAGGRSSGPGALARALLTRVGHFTVGPFDSAVAPNLTGDADGLLLGARGLVRSLSSERGQGPGRQLGCDEAMLHKRLEGSDERRSTMIETLVMGGDVRRAAQQMAFKPDEARELLEDLFRFGAIGIVRHIEGEQRPSSDRAVSALSRFAAGVPEELRPLFELEETEVSSYVPEDFAFDFEEASGGSGGGEQEVSAGGVDLSLSFDSGSVRPKPPSYADVDVELPEAVDVELVGEALVGLEAEPGPGEPVAARAAFAAEVPRLFGTDPDEDGFDEALTEVRVTDSVEPEPDGSAHEPLVPAPGEPGVGVVEGGTPPRPTDAPPSPPRPARPRSHSLLLAIVAVSLALAVAGGVLAGIAIVRARRVGAALIVTGTGPDAPLGPTVPLPPPPAAPTAPVLGPPALDGGAMLPADAAPADASTLEASVRDAAPSDATVPDGAAASVGGDGGPGTASDAGTGRAAGEDGGAGPAWTREDLGLMDLGPPIRVPTSERLLRRMLKRELQAGARATKRQDFERAAWHYDRVLTLQAGTPTGMVGLGESLVRLGRHEAARQVLGEAADVLTTHEPLVRTGYACLSAGDPGCARRAFEKALAIRRTLAARRGLAAVEAAERDR